MKSISLHMLMTISMLHLASFLSTKVNNRVMYSVYVYMCNLCTRNVELLSSSIRSDH